MIRGDGFVFGQKPADSAKILAAQYRAIPHHGIFAVKGPGKFYLFTGDEPELADALAICFQLATLEREGNLQQWELREAFQKLGAALPREV